LKNYAFSAVLSFALVLLVGAAAMAAPSVFGLSGNILTPDDLILAPGTFNLAYHGISFDGGDNENIFSGNVGVFPNLEVGASVLTNGDSDVIFNGKYRLLTETGTRPAVTVGVIDLASTAFADPGLFIMVSKSLTTAAEEVTDRPSKPLRGHLGIGSGVLSSVFLGLDWTVTPQLSVMLEYISDSDFGGSLFNGGVRYAVSDNLRLDLSLIDFDDFTYGISYQAIKF
jgi:hypothetical protein